MLMDAKQIPNIEVDAEWSVPDSPLTRWIVPPPPVTPPKDDAPVETMVASAAEVPIAQDPAAE